MEPGCGSRSGSAGVLGVMKEVAWANSIMNSSPRANLTHCSVGVVETSSNDQSDGRRLRVESGAKSNDASERKSLCILLTIPRRQ